MSQAEKVKQPRRALEVLAVAVVLAAAAFLRDANLRWGLPNAQHYFSYHPDEIFLLLPSFGFAAGDWNPGFFNYGTLYIYLVGIPALLLGLVPGRASFPEHLAPLYLLARTITMVLGVATVLLLYLALRRRGRFTAWLSALLLALCPLHLVTSAYATVDVPSTFWITLAFLLALRAADQPSPKWGALVGLAVGLAAATKYNAGLFLVPALLAPVIVPPRAWRQGYAACVVGGAALGFVIGCPFFWTGEFLRDFLFEVQHARVGGTLAFVDTGNGWWYHLSRGLPFALGYPLLAAFLLGLIAALRRPTRASTLALFSIFLYLLVIGFSKERFIRYLVPITPFLCLVSAQGLALLPRLSRRRWPKAIAVTLACALIAASFACAFTMDLVRGIRDPRDSAMAALEERARRPGVLRVGLVAAPWFCHPPVSPYNAGPFSRRFFSEWNRERGDPVAITGWDAQSLRDQRPDVFFLSDLESMDRIRLRDPDAVAFVEALDSIYKQRTSFSQSPPIRLAPDPAWAPPDWRYESPRIIMYESPRP